MEKRERVKLYMVIALLAVFVLVGYIRFFGGKTASPVQSNLAAAAGEAITVPAVDLKGLQQAPRAPEKVLPSSTPLRNIFIPFVPAEKRPVAKDAPQEPAGAPQKSLITLKLTGTIIGGGRPLAVINGRFLGRGESIEGFQILSIDRNAVIIAKEGQKVTLNVLDGK